MSAHVRETTVRGMVSAPVVARERSQSLPEAVRPTTWETMGRPLGPVAPVAVRSPPEPKPLPASAAPFGVTRIVMVSV